MGIVGWLELQLDQGSEWKWQVKWRQATGAFQSKDM